MQVSQPGESYDSDGVLQVTPDIPVQINVPVSGHDFKSPEDRTTIVKLNAGAQILSKTVNLADIKAAGAGTFMVPFEVTFAPQNIGLQAISATIDPGNALNESNFSNNTASTKVNVSTAGMDLEIVDVSLSQSADGTAVPQDSDKNNVIATVTPENSVPAPKIAPTPVQVKVKVNMTGTPPTHGGFTFFDMSINGEIVAAQSVDVSTFKQGENIVTVTYTPLTDQRFLGPKILEVAINANGFVKETNYTNNSKSIPINTMVLCKVEDAQVKNANGEDAHRIVQFWSQVDPEWEDQTFGNKENSDYENPTMHDFGCPIANLAMLFDSYGIKSTPMGSPVYPASTVPFNPPDGLNGEVLNPGSLDYAMTNYKKDYTTKGSVGFTYKNDVDWVGAANVARAGYRAQCSNPANECDPNNANKAVSYKEKNDDGYTDIEAIKKVQNEICAGNPVIMKFRKKPTIEEPNGTHFMLATGVSWDDKRHVQTLRLNNPGTVHPEIGKSVLYSEDTLKKTYPSIIGYVLYHTFPDPSMMLITAPMNVQLVITDPLGRKTGFDPTLGKKYSEIPGASYSEQSINTPGDPEWIPATLVEERYFMSSLDVPAGAYQVQVFSVDGGTYYLDYRSYDLDGMMNDAHLQTGTLQQGSSTTVVFQHVTSPSPDPNATLQYSKYFITKSDNQNPKDSDVRLTGIISPYVKTSIALSSDFAISIGGLTGYQFNLPSSAFTVKIQNQKNIYTYSSHGIMIQFDSSGAFDIHIYHADLSSVDPDLLGYMTMTIDSIVGSKRLNMSCQGNKCSGL